MRYELLVYSQLDTFNEEINKYSETGWKLYGTHTITPDRNRDNTVYFAQAMVKND